MVSIAGKRAFVILLAGVMVASCTSDRAVPLTAGPVKVEKKPAVSASDHHGGGEAGQGMATPAVEPDQNQPPRIVRLYFVPRVFKPGDRYGVEVETEDPEGDPVKVRYTWYVNDRWVGDGPRLEEPVRRGDRIMVHVVPYDGEKQGEAVTLKRTVLNMPPVLTQSMELDFDGGTYLYQVRAEDPDGDPVTYRLEGAPAGMSISRDSGLITWQVPDSVPEQNPPQFTVLAEDGHGGVLRYRLTVRPQG